MQREILTYPLDDATFRDELAFVIDYLVANHVNTCDVLFGYAWGFKYYPGELWQSESVAVCDLGAKVSQVETSGIGRLGEDDLIVECIGLEFRFCHDSDVHLCFTESNPHVEYFYERWKQLGYQPAEWIKNEQHGPGERVRFN